MKNKLRKKTRRWQAAETMAVTAESSGSGEQNAQRYNAVIAATLRFLDEVTGKDVTGNYPTKYNRKTPLNKIGIQAQMRPMLAQRYDREVREILVALGHPVAGREIRADDMRDAATIETLFRMACAIYSVPVPQG